MRQCKYCSKDLEKKAYETNKKFLKRIYCGNSCRTLDVPLSRRMIGTRTKGEVFKSCRNWQSARSIIRKDAERIISRSDIELKCKVCFYTNHVEVCHIKSVSSFSDESTIDDINNIDNLVLLCPNCHWEFDNNLLKL